MLIQLEANLDRRGNPVHMHLKISAALVFDTVPLWSKQYACEVQITFIIF